MGRGDAYLTFVGLTLTNRIKKAENKGLLTSFSAFLISCTNKSSDTQTPNGSTWIIEEKTKSDFAHIYSAPSQKVASAIVLFYRSKQILKGVLYRNSVSVKRFKIDEIPHMSIKPQYRNPIIKHMNISYFFLNENLWNRIISTDRNTLQLLSVF